MSFRSRIAIGLGWGAAFLLLVILLGYINVSHVLSAVRSANLIYIPSCILIVLAVRILNAYQLIIAIRRQNVSLTLWRSFAINTIASFYGLFLPGILTAGAVKWYKLASESGKRAEAFATMAFVKTVNTVLIFSLGLLAVGLEGSAGLWNLSWLMLALVLGIFALCVMFLIGKHKENRECWLRKAPFRVPNRLLTSLQIALNALRQYRWLSPMDVIILLAVPLISQVLTGLLFSLVALALHLCIPFMTAIWLVSLVYFLQLFPTSISGLGLREGALVILLPRYGVGAADALAFSLLVFSFTVFFGLIGGLFEVREVLAQRSWIIAAQAEKTARQLKRL